ncbi:ribosomal protein L25, putative [Plasmodium malariae]|uniref:Ribosomal protein L25, putative n=1 Tax=Plasmodium malariae TaxID=5858 RepID=A0A1C3K9Z4_PLAMA|nr:ribosomal protein L25, putative [Plasmodium malariae]
MNLFKLSSWKNSYFMYHTKRNHLNYKLYLKFKQWDYLKKEIINYFNSNSKINTVVDLKARRWEKFKKKELIQVHGYVPAIIWKYGIEKRICIDHKLIDEYAFEEDDGHLSLLFSARLFRIHIEGDVIECVVSHVEADPRLIGCPAYINGYHVQLALNYIKCKVMGNNIPPPFQIDVSKLTYKEPYNSIKLKDLMHLLPENGDVIFSEDYDLNETEVVWTYEPGKLFFLKKKKKKKKFPPYMMLHK